MISPEIAANLHSCHTIGKKILKNIYRSIHIPFEIRVPSVSHSMGLAAVYRMFEKNMFNFVIRVVSATDGLAQYDANTVAAATVMPKLS